MITEINAIVVERCGPATGSHVIGSGRDRKKSLPEVTGRNRVRLRNRFPCFFLSIVVVQHVVQ